MFINQVCKITGLTKKAVEYYTQRGLVTPSLLENGYRDYNKTHIGRLQKVSVLRKLGLSVEEIQAVLSDASNSALQAVSVRKELDSQREEAKKAILSKLCGGASYADISGELQAVEDGKTITEKLLEAFPGYYGRFVCLHFARFLNEPIKTESQRAAFWKIISFLDHVPSLALPPDLQDFLIESTKHIGTGQMTEILNSTKKSIENPEEFLSGNQEILEQYLAYQQSDEYKNSPACKIKELMKEFNRTSGYNDIFIPALQQLSSSYAEYCRQLELANEKLISRYPEIQRLSGQQE